MELPKNITQIGESNPHCKIYVEDYAISYIKQVNVQAADKQQAVALYGRRTEENGITYIFLYGACRLQFLQRESRHLSQAVLLEAEKQRKKYFMEHTFLAYCMLQGEMLEGFYVCDHGTCRYVEGYARFFEKNDSMLTFMLSDRQEEAQPEVVEQEKYETVRRRQEVRRESFENNTVEMRRSVAEESKMKEAPMSTFGRMRWAAAAVFAVLCVAGLLNLGKGAEFSDIQVAARQIIDALTEQKLPDEAQMVSASAQAGRIVAEDKLTEALKAENSLAEGQQTAEVRESAPSADGTPTEQPEIKPTDISTPEPSVEPTPVPTEVPTPEPTEVPTPEPTAVPVSYVVREGDTLSAICWKIYGSDKLMEQVCEMNDIDNPDDIKVGEKILLPQ